MIQVGYASNVTESEKINKTLETLGSSNTAVAMALRAGKHPTLDKLLYALREHNTNNHLMIMRGKQIQRREVCETNFTVSKGRIGKAKPNKQSGKQNSKPKTKGWAKHGKVLPCFTCGKTGHLAKECRASKEEQQRYLWHYHVERHRSGVEAHGTEVKSPKTKEPVGLVGDGQPMVNTNTTQVSNLPDAGEMDIDEQELLNTLCLEDRLQV
jgi:hypothetical protein